MNEIENQFFNRGFAEACAILLKMYDQPSMVMETYAHNFMTIEELKRSGVDKFDIDILRPIIKEYELKNEL